MSDFLKYWDTRIDANERFFNNYPQIANFAFSECQALWEHMEEEIKALLASHNALVEAVTPSAETKIAFISEFSFRPSGYIANKYSDAMERVIVPWVTIKEIMNAIKQRAEATCTNTPRG